MTTLSNHAQKSDLNILGNEPAEPSAHMIHYTDLAGIKGTGIKQRDLNAPLGEETRQLAHAALFSPFIVSGNAGTGKSSMRRTYIIDEVAQ